MIERLGLLGIRTIGDFAALPRPVVEAQFGRAGGRAWLAARGEDPSQLRPRPFEREQVIERVQEQPPLGGKVVEVAGLVVCRQRPMTAKGIIFLLLEDEFGLMNVLVSRELGERERAVVRLSPFVVVRGVLEQRAGGQRTLVARSLRELLPAEVLSMPTGKSWC